VVDDVTPDTPAAGSGLQAGDVITAIAGRTVDSSDALSAILRTFHPGDKVSVAWSDQNGDSHSTTVTLASGPAS
jgi:S1-C subfamily serine protease